MGVTLHGTGQYATLIGIRYNKEHTKFVRAWFYFGTDESKANEEADKRREQWHAIKRGWKERQKREPALAELEPHWTDDQLQTEADKVTPSDTLDMDTSVSRVKDFYLAWYGKRIETGRINQNTYNNFRNFLTLAINPPTKTPIAFTASTPIGKMTTEAVESLVNYWLGSAKSGEISKRTAANYCRAFKQMLDWLGDRPNLGFVMPKGLRDTFNFGNVKETENTTYTDEQLTALLVSSASDRCKLYFLLALNTGANQNEIATLKRDEVNLEEGSIYCRRAKTLHQNSLRTYYKLWPETAALLKTHMAKENPLGLALLNRDGGPLITVTEGLRINNITSCFKRTVQGMALVLAGVRRKDLKKKGAVKTAVAKGMKVFNGNPTFKTFRKTSGSAIRRIAQSKEIGEQFLAHAIPTSGKDYFSDEPAAYARMNEALATYRDELLKAGIPL